MQPLQMSDAQIEEALEAIGEQVVEWLRSYTGETRTGLRKGDPDRKAHPGKWADVRGPDAEGSLASSYGYRIEREGQNHVLVLYNDAEHAKWVERMDAYWVLEGVFGQSDVLTTIQHELLKHLT